MNKTYTKKQIINFLNKWFKGIDYVDTIIARIESDLK